MFRRHIAIALPVLAVLSLPTSCRTTDSRDGTAQAAQAEAFMESGEWTRAAELYTEAILTGPYNPSVQEWRLGRGTAWLEAGMADRALAVGDSLAAETGSSMHARAMMLIARSLFRTGRWQRCADALGLADPEDLPGGGAEEADSLALACLRNLAVDQLVSLRSSNWLEPFVLFELTGRYESSGDATRAALTAGELERLYPGFRGRHGSGGQVVSPERGFIALVLPMTGEGSAYASQVEAGVRLRFERAADLMPSMPELVVMDTGGEADALESIARSLGENPGCLAVIGPLTSNETEIFAPYAQEFDLPILSPAATSADIDRIGDFVHRLVPAGTDEAVTVAEYAVRNAGCERLAILHSYTGTSVAQAEQFTAAVQSLGAQVVRTEAFETDDTNFRSQIFSIRATRPDGIFIPVSAYEAVQIAPQLRFYSVDALLLGTSGLDDEVTLRLGGEYVEGAVFTCSFGAGSVYPPTSRFVFHYNRKYGTDPGILAAQGYDAASVLLDAFGNGAENREDFERALDSVTSIQGACGICTIGARTVSRVALPLVMVSDGEIVGVE